MYVLTDLLLVILKLMKFIARILKNLLLLSLSYLRIFLDQKKVKQTIFGAQPGSRIYLNELLIKET